MIKVGIWGLGVAAKSAIRYLHKKGYQLGVMDKRALSEQECSFLAEHATTYFHEEQKDQFFSAYNRIIPSQSIDVRPYPHISQKWWAELDAFAAFTTRPSIAVTGTLGKTSVTYLLSQALTALGVPLVTGGNIGVGLFDLALQTPELYVLELSSFQLELAHEFAPHLAIITNIYPNHLDRHTFAQYVAAKIKLLRHQQPHQNALVHADAVPYIKNELPERPLCLFSLDRPAQARPLDTLYYFDGTTPIKEYLGRRTQLAQAADVPKSSFATNWLTVIAALDILGKPLPHLHSLGLTLPEHRIQHVAQVAGVDFYDDSKATVPQATLAAVDRLSSKPIILLLGGTSKGVDRRPLAKALTHKVKSVYCFGLEADELATYCNQAGIATASHKTLEQAVSAAIDSAQAGDQILLSPSGASYDLFKDYTHRGEVFQRLVREHLTAQL